MWMPLFFWSVLHRFACTSFLPTVWTCVLAIIEDSRYKTINYEFLLQILLDDVKVSEQLLDLVFYLLIVLGGYRQVLLISLLELYPYWFSLLRLAS